MSTTLRLSKLLDHCTQSISYDRQVQAAATAFDEQMYEIIDVTDGVVPGTVPPPTPVPAVPPIFTSPAPTSTKLSEIIFIPLILQLADSDLVDILAWQFHVDFYDHTKPLAFRRQLVQDSIQWHMRKGTVALLQEVLDRFWPGGATLTEWFEYDDPLPPNYPVDGADLLIGTFTPIAVDTTADTITMPAHGLVNADIVRFAVGFAIGNLLPMPLVSGIWYRVVSATTNNFKVSNSIGGKPIDLTTQGTATVQLYKKGSGSWHDRYRFRVYIDETIILPEDEAQVLALINAYKPVSRWLEGLFRSTISDCAIGWYGACLEFIYISSDAPDFLIEAHGYDMTGPTTGAPAVSSAPFTVTLRTGAAVADVVTITPTDHGAGGTFTPASVTLTTLDRTASFAYTPASEGSHLIDVKNDGGLANPPGITVVSTTPKYTLAGPASGDVGSASAPFTVASTDVHAGTVTITPSDGGAGGTFTPSTVQLTAAVTSATFTYTPLAAGTVSISATNDGGLADAAALSYNAIPFNNASVPGMKLWLKASAVTPVPADGTQITLLPDSSGLSNHATAAAAAGFIYYANGLRAFNANRERINALPAEQREHIQLQLMGKPILQAYGSMQMLLTTAISGTPPWTVIAVLYNAIYNTMGSIGDKAVQGTRGVYIRAPSSAATIIDASDGNYTHETAAIATSDQWGIYTVVCRALGDADIYFNGVLVSHTMSYVPLGVTVFNAIGNYNGVAPMSGFLTEIDLFDNAVSASNLTKLHNAIKAEYGLT
jgi:Phage tail protein (Tail_P2_I)